MNKIASIHQKILDNFIIRHEIDPTFCFATRKSNRKNRLDEGYWFLGNEEYVQLSFWNGIDWKEKIYNIGFVVWHHKHFAIELVAQDSDNKKALMEEIVMTIPGFNKAGNKNKWYKHYEGTDYLLGLAAFLLDEKPTIDELVKKHSGNGIKVLDFPSAKKDMQRVIELRHAQIEFGTINKITRVTWNTNGWTRPSGPGGKSSSKEAYESQSGYGHEEWLLDKQRIIKGYHYGFLQSLNLSTDRHLGNFYNITLFTNDKEGNSFTVGEIRQAECIDEETSIRIYDAYKRKGWLEEMEKDIVAAGASIEKFKETPANIFFNVRFRFENTTILDEPEELDADDVNITTNHFKLLPRRTKDLKRQYVQLPELEDDDPGKKKNTAKRTKTYNVYCEYDPYHDMMQNEIFDLLKQGIDGYSHAKMEKSYVDIRAKNGDDWHFFEIKTDCPRICIRKALGQVMEYAFYPDLEHAKKLVVIGDADPDENVQLYLNRIRANFAIPVYYRSFNIHTKKLSKEY
jgi:hypothetical protein